MKVELLGDDLQPIKLNTRRVLVFGDDNVTPVAVVLEYMPNMIFVADVEDPNFNKTLEQLGIKYRVNLTTLKPKALDTFKLPAPI